MEPQRQQDPPLAQPRAVLARGPADNAEVFGSLLQGGGLLPVILWNLDMGPFTRQAVQTNSVGLDGFILASCLTSLRVSNRVLRRQQLIAEMLAPHCPEVRILGRDESRAELAWILDNTVLSDQTWFIDTIVEMNQTDAEDTRGVRRLWDPTEREWVGQVLLDQKLELLAVVSQHLPDRSRLGVRCSILMCILSFAVRGQISQARLTKVMHEFSRLMPGVAEQFTHSDIALTWRHFGGLVDDSSVADTFAHWLGYLDAPAVRVRIIIAQAAGSLTRRHRPGHP